MRTIVVIEHDEGFNPKELFDQHGKPITVETTYEVDMKGPFSLGTELAMADVRQVAENGDYDIDGQDGILEDIASDVYINENNEDAIIELFEEYGIRKVGE